MRFTALGTNARNVTVIPSNSPTPYEFIDSNLVKKTMKLTDGSVSIACEVNINGRVRTPTDNGVPRVVMTLSGAGTQTAMTDTAGNYNLKALPGNYTLTPSKNNETNRTNGVSTLDLALVQSHILDRRKFGNAYQVIAADADNSSSVTTSDILQIRRLILGIDTSLPGNRTWAFVDADQTFPNIANPFPFQSSKTLTNLSGDVTQRFRAIKVGDVNYDRNPLLDQAPSGDTLRLSYEWTDTRDGYLTLRLNTGSIDRLHGYQATLEWDAAQLSLDRILSNPTGIGIGERWRDEGALALSWNDPRALGISFSEGMTLLEIRFQKKANSLNTTLTLSDRRIVREAFNANLQSVGLSMRASAIRSEASGGLPRVFPNPAGREVNVEWVSERRGSVAVRLFDATGRLTHEHRAIYEAGSHRHTIRRDGSLAAAGTWMVQVVQDGVVRNVPVVFGRQVPEP
jgi:hypothetical protein